MLECSLCDYYLKPGHPGANQSKTVCEFTGHIFAGESGLALEEYPCRNVSYGDYLIAREHREPAAPKIDHLPCGEWRFIYLKRRRLFQTVHI